MSQLRTNSIVPAGGIPAGASGGGIIQTVSVVKTDTFSATSQAGVVVTGLEASITPRSTSNKILIMAGVHYSEDPGNESNAFFFGKNGSIITSAIADAAGSRPRVAMHGFSADQAGGPTENGMSCSFLTILDSPSTTSSVTYSLMMRSANGTTAYVNRTVSDRNTANFDPRTISTITVMEISG